MKGFILTIVTLGSLAFAKAQSQCAAQLSIYAENAKAKNYDEAYKQLQGLLEKCPDESAAIYQYGERIFEHRLKKDKGEKSENVDGLIQMIEKQIKDYPDVVNVTRKRVELARIKFKNDVGSREKQFETFETIMAEDPEEFTDPMGLVYYFVVAENLYKNEKISLQELFDVYDKIITRIEEEQSERSERLSRLIDKKEDPDQELTNKEEKIISYDERNLKSYEKVKTLVNQKLGPLADCDQLIPLYEEQIEENMDNEQWLTDAIRRLNSKDCTDADIYITVVKALNEIRPSAKTTYSLGRIADTKSEQIELYKKALELDPGNDLKSRIHYKLGKVYRDMGRYGSAKKQFLKSVEAKPSFGTPLLLIANMIANSANNCGDTPYEKRAVNWVAARYAQKAARIDPSISSSAASAAQSYRDRAPSTSDTFMEGNYKSGQRLTFTCWVGESVTIP